MAARNLEKAFLGIGWGFPTNVRNNGALNVAVFEEDIRQAILIILGTARGERVMRPDFGSGLYTLVFEPVNKTTMALVRYEVEQALIDWEPRIDLEDVTVTTDATERNTLLIDISYRVRTTNSRHNLVYPFFLLEGQR